MTTKIQLLTIADWEAMPHGDGNIYEIIEGELFVSCSPGLTHQVILTNLIATLGNFLRTNRIGTGVNNPPVVLSNYTGVLPDVVFFTKEQRDTIITNDRLTGPPALVAEILSPGSSNIRRDRVVKLQLYAKHGVPEYWIIDLKSQSVERYVNQGSSLSLQETGFSCRVSEIFSHF